MSARIRLQAYLEDERIKKVHDRVKSAFDGRDFVAHGWDHIYRDIINAIWIGEAESADIQIVLPAILLHDIGFLYNPDPAVHNVIGAEKCVEWLDDWSEVGQKKISGCILLHKSQQRNRRQKRRY